MNIAELKLEFIRKIININDLEILIKIVCMHSLF